MKIIALAAVTACVLLAPRAADAQPLVLEINDGLVTLQAQNVPVRQILTEWARVGGAKIVNGDKVVGAPVTLQLDGVPERQAIDIILRSVSGYMLAARQPGETGVSAFDRILILPTSSAPRASASSPAAGFNRAIRPRPVPVPQPTDMTGMETEVDPEEEPATDVDDEGGAEVVAPVQPGMINRFQRRPNAFPNPMNQPQVQPFVPNPDVQEFPQADDAPVEDTTTVPPNPFGVGAGSATPGVVSPVPQPEPGQYPQGQYPQYPQTRPPTTTRPPR